MPFCSLVCGVGKKKSQFRVRVLLSCFFFLLHSRALFFPPLSPFAFRQGGLVYLFFFSSLYSAFLLFSFSFFSFSFSSDAPELDKLNVLTVDFTK